MPRREAATIKGSWPEGWYSSRGSGVDELSAPALGELAHHVEEVQPHAPDQDRFPGRDGGPVDIGGHSRREVAAGPAGPLMPAAHAARVEPGGMCPSARTTESAVSEPPPASPTSNAVPVVPVPRLPGSTDKASVSWKTDGDAVGELAESSSSVQRR